MFLCEAARHLLLPWRRCLRRSWKAHHKEQHCRSGEAHCFIVLSPCMWRAPFRTQMIRILDHSHWSISGTRNKGTLQRFVFKPPNEGFRERMLPCDDSSSVELFTGCNFFSFFSSELIPNTKKKKRRILRSRGQLIEEEINEVHHQSKHAQWHYINK